MSVVTSRLVATCWLRLIVALCHQLLSGWWLDELFACRFSSTNLVRFQQRLESLVVVLQRICCLPQPPQPYQSTRSSSQSIHCSIQFVHVASLSQTNTILLSTDDCSAYDLYISSYNSHTSFFFFFYLQLSSKKSFPQAFLLLKSQSREKNLTSLELKLWYHVNFSEPTTMIINSAIKTHYWLTAQPSLTINQWKENQ